MNAELLKGHLDLLLLAIVAERPAHGYAIIAALRERSAGTFDLPEGTIYPALHRLEHAGLLRSGWAPGANRSRRIYEITAQGVEALQERRTTWGVFARGVQAVIGGVA
ncbi:MAG TPA: helix-turn-helix transcriptional regulator [Dehalococcoidia bacterium]|nr:helix-turn-helix transcriptional regulator [Dehalococcoidia bacterium]